MKWRTLLQRVVDMLAKLIVQVVASSGTVQDQERKTSPKRMGFRTDPGIIEPSLGRMSWVKSFGQVLKNLDQEARRCGPERKVDIHDIRGIQGNFGLESFWLIFCSLQELRYAILSLFFVN